MTSKVALRYAKALFDSSIRVEQQHLLRNFEDLLFLYNKLPRIYAFLNSPEISKAQKEKVLNMAFKESPKFLGFLSILLQKGRFKYLKNIAEQYHEIYTTSYGITYAQLTTAVPLEDETKEHLKEKLNRTYNKQFEVLYDVDPPVIGGGVLVIADRMIDFSIKDKLNRLKAKLLM